MDHVQLAMPVGREDDARSFYSVILGLREVEKPEALRTRGGCWFLCGRAHVHLGVESEFKPARKAHVALCVTDLDAAAAKLAAQGYGIDWDETVPGRRRFYTNDCFGNRLELLAEGDGFSQR